VTGSVASPPPPPLSFLRPALALLAGLGVIVLIVGVGTIIATLGALRGVDPKSFQPSPLYRSVVIALTVFGAFAGGFTTGRITAGRSLFTVLLLALMLLVSGIVPVLRNSASLRDPRWYSLTLAIVSPLAIVAGGLFERRRMRAPVSPPPVAS
jgi:hypothetical protein